MRMSSGRQGIRIFVVALLVAITGVVVASPLAQASTGGGATARAVDIDLAGIAGVFGGLNLVSPLVNAPAANGTVVDNTIAAPPAGVTLGVITNSATRGPLSTSASSQVAGTSIDILGLPLLRTGVINAAVTCPFSGTGTSLASAAGVSVLGTNVTVTNVGVTVNATVAGIADVSATISEVEDPGHASSIALQVTIDPLLLPPVDVGTIVLADATCTAPTAPDAPTAASITPTEGPTAGGTAVTLTGTNFVPGAAVFVGGVAATNVTVVDATTITFQTPPHAAGVVDIIVTTAGGPGTLPFAFTYIALPTATALSPNLGPTSGGTLVTVTGSGFIAGATSVNLAPGTIPPGLVDVTSTTSLTFTTTGNLPGPRDVTVTTSGGTSTPALTYTFVAPPTVAELVPAFGPTTGGTGVGVIGSGFVAGETSVTIGATVIPPAQVGVGDDSHLSFTTPPGTGPGPVDVVVSTTNGGPSNAQTFTYFDVPSMTSIAPDEGPVAGTNDVVVTGTGFVADFTTFIVEDPTGTFHLIAATDVAVGLGGTTATFAMPASSGLLPGAAFVTGATAGLSAPQTLDYTYRLLPTVSSVTPLSGPTAGGTPVTIVGTNFVVGSTDVEFAGVPALDVVVAADGNSLTAVTPPNAEGPAAVSVTTAGGESVDNVQFTYFALPTVATIAPAFGPIAGGTPVTLTGQDLTGATSVEFGGVPGTNVVVAPDGLSLTVTTPAHAEGSAAVVVRSPGGASTDDITFTYVAVPTATGLVPNDGRVAGGTSVTITGSGFVDGQTTVTIGGSDVPAADVTVSSATSVTFLTPAHAAGPVGVTVTTPGGGPTLPLLTFTYREVPTVTSLLPDSGPTSGGQTPVTVTGTGFVDGATTVTFNGVPATFVNVVGDTQLTLTTPPGPAGLADIVVETAGGPSAPAALYTYIAPPTATSIAPPSGPVAGGTSVTITGTNFVDGQTLILIVYPNNSPDFIAARRHHDRWRRDHGNVHHPGVSRRR